MSSSDAAVTLLLTDDPNTPMRDWLNMYSLIEASNLETALALLEQQPVDVVVVNTETPEIPAAALHNHKKWEKIPLLVIVPPDEAVVNHVLEIGVQYVMMRPVYPALLKQQVQGILSAVRDQVQSSEREQSYRKLIESTSDVVFNIGTDTSITYLSAVFEHVTGWSPQAWIGRSFVPLIYMEDLPQAMRIFQALMRGESPPAADLRFNTPKGKVGVGEFIAQPIFKGGKVVGAWGAVRDVTRRQRAEDSERRQRVLAEALRDTAAALNSTLDRDKLFDMILEQVARVVPTGYSNVMLIEDGMARVVRARGYESIGFDTEVRRLRFDVKTTPNLRQMIDTGRPYSIPDVTTFPGWVHDVSTEWIRSHMSAPIRVNNEVIGFLNLDNHLPNSFSDSDGERLQAFAEQAGNAIRNADLYDHVRRQAEDLERRVQDRTAQIEREQAQLRAILDSMHEGVYYDENYQVRYINRALTKLIGYSSDEILKNLPSVKDPKSPLYMPAADESIAQGRVWVNDVRIKRKDGSEFDASVTVTPVFSSSGERMGAVTVIRDVSQEKALESQKARFVANASHELRTPITNFKTRLYLLQKQPEKMAQHLQILDELTERMRRLIEDLLDTSRFEQGLISMRPRPVILQTLAENVVNMQSLEAAQKKIELVADFSIAPLVIYADPERIIQAITNLVVNAITYTLADGKVIVRVMSGSACCAVVEVEDSGIGIAPEHILHIFQPFFRANHSIEGNGLGLSITRQIIELHHGTITVESTPGRGSIFRLTLPLADTIPEAAGTNNALQSS